MGSRFGTRAAGESFTFLLIAGGILVLLNVLVAFFPSPRIDVTDSGLFSLADGSKRVVSSLDDRLEITAYFTKDLPPPFNATESQVRDILSEYAAASNEDIVVTFVDPDSEVKQAAAEADGVQRVAHQKIEEDQVSVVEGYRGIVLKYLGKDATIPVIEDTEGLEYQITSTIKGLTGERKSIGVLAEHATPMLEEGLTKLSSLLELYEIKEIDTTKEIDPTLAALLIIDAQQPFTEDELRYIDQYVMGGGSLGVFGGAVAVDIAHNAPGTRPVDTGLDQLVRAWGVSLPPKMVLDAQCSRAPITNPLGLQVLVPYPPIAVLQLTEDQQKHPVMMRLGAPMLAFSSPLEIGTPPPEASITVLANSSDNSWAVDGKSLSLEPRDPREWEMTADLGPFPLIVAIEGTLPSAFESVVSEGGQSSAIEAPPKSKMPVRVLVAGTGTYLEDTFLPDPGDKQIQLNATQALALNSIDWLASDPDLIAIRAKNVESPALAIPDSLLAAEDTLLAAAEGGDETVVEEALATRKQAMEAWDHKKLAYRWVNTVGLPLLVVLFGLFRWRRRARTKRTLTLDTAT